MPRPDARRVTAGVREESGGALDDLLFGTAPPPGADTPSVAVTEALALLDVAEGPMDQPTPAVEAAPSAPRPRAPRSRRRLAPAAPAIIEPRTVAPTIAVPPAPGSPTSYGRSRYLQLTVPLPLAVHAALRDAAVARGSIREMSAIVREAIDAYLSRLEAMGEQERGSALAAAVGALNEARAHGRRDVAYRLEEEQRARLLPFSGAQGIPMSALAAAAIGAALTATG